MNVENPSTEQASETQPVSTQRVEPEPPLEPQHRDPQPQDPRRRLRELLSIADRERSDAVWDEIIELEIQLAPGNRVQGVQTDAGRRQEPARRQDSGRRPEQARRQDPAFGTKPNKRIAKKPKRSTEVPAKK